MNLKIFLIIFLCILFFVMFSGDLGLNGPNYEGFSSEQVQNIASLYNDNKIVSDEIEVKNNGTIGGDLAVSGKINVAELDNSEGLKIKPSTTLENNVRFKKTPTLEKGQKITIIDDVPWNEYQFGQRMKSHFSTDMPDGTIKQFILIHRHDNRDYMHMVFTAGVKYGKVMLWWRNGEHHNIKDPVRFNSNNDHWWPNI